MARRAGGGKYCVEGCRFVDALDLRRKGYLQPPAPGKPPYAVTANCGGPRAAGFCQKQRLRDRRRILVSGADPIGDRPGFKAMLDRIAGNGVRTIIVESPDRFARDLIVQLTGHDYLKTLGVELVPASAPDFFLTDTPTAVLVRQVLGAISQFEKTSLVAKLKAARDRKRATGVKVEGRRSHSELRPEVVAAAKLLHKQERLSYREISARLFEAGHINKHGDPFSASSIKSMLQS